MLKMTRCENVCVVVSRWFGGIHLGSDRFKCINNAARVLLIATGVGKCSENGRSGKGSGAKAKK